MADRTSAEIFSRVIEAIADSASDLEALRAIVVIAKEYDFSYEQLSENARRILENEDLDYP